MAETLRFAVGSLNPVKLQAARDVLPRLYSGADVAGVSVPSGVADQPFGDEETRRGARQRAEAARAALDADFGLGLEGGVVEEEDGSLRTCAWACLVRRDGAFAFGGSLALTLPPEVAKLVRSGMELGPAMDALSGETNVKHKMGAVGLLTLGLVDRRAAYAHLVAFAAAGFARDDA